MFIQAWKCVKIKQIKTRDSRSTVCHNWLVLVSGRRMRTAHTRTHTHTYTHTRARAHAHARTHARTHTHTLKSDFFFRADIFLSSICFSKQEIRVKWGANQSVSFSSSSFSSSSSSSSSSFSSSSSSCSCFLLLLLFFWQYKSQNHNKRKSVILSLLRFRDE